MTRDRPSQFDQDDYNLLRAALKSGCEWALVNKHVVLAVSTQPLPQAEPMCYWVRINTIEGLEQ